MKLHAKLLATTAIISAFAFQAQATPQAQNPSNYIVTKGLTTTVTQIVDGVQNFNFKTIDTSKDEALIFKQPSTTAIAVAHILDGQMTQFDGALKANGRVVIINPEGMLFSGTSRVNVNALSLVGATATTNMKLPSGVQGFETTDTLGDVTVNGTVTTANGGFVNLVGKDVNIGSSANISTGKLNVNAGADTYAVGFNGTATGSGNKGKGGYIISTGTTSAITGTNFKAVKGNGASLINTSGVNDVSTLSGNVTLSGRLSGGTNLNANAGGDLSFGGKVGAYNVNLASGGNTTVGAEINAFDVNVNAAKKTTLNSGFKLDSTLTVTSQNDLEADSVQLSKQGLDLTSVNGSVTVTGNTTTYGGFEINAKHGAANISGVVSNTLSGNLEAGVNALTTNFTNATIGGEVTVTSPNLNISNSSLVSLDAYANEISINNLTVGGPKSFGASLHGLGSSQAHADKVAIGNSNFSGLTVYANTISLSHTASSGLITTYGQTANINNVTTPDMNVNDNVVNIDRLNITGPIATGQFRVNGSQILSFADKINITNSNINENTLLRANDVEVGGSNFLGTFSVTAEHFNSTDTNFYGTRYITQK